MPDTISAMTVSTFLDGSKEFVQRIHEQKIAERERKKRFNIFDVLRYIRRDENFHSDIIAYLLNPSERHGLGNKPLERFIELLNKLAEDQEKEVDINPESFRNASVEREEGKIDILIESGDKKTCILIENKIHWASDQPEQLARYYESQRDDKSGDNVKAIVYLTPDEREKRPSEQTYGNYKDKIEKKLIILEAYPKDAKDATDTNNLSDGWIKPLLDAQSSEATIDVNSFVRQYLDILEQEKNERIMNEHNVIAFLNHIGGDEEKLNTALAISDILSPIRDRIFASKIIRDLQERNKIGTDDYNCTDRDSETNYVYIHLYNLSCKGHKNSFNCEMQIHPREPNGTWQTIEIFYLEDISGEELRKVGEMLGIEGLDFYPNSRKARLYYKDYKNGLQYFNNQDQFYQTVEDIANKFLSLRATQ